MTYDPTRPVRQQITDLHQQALRQPIRPSWRQRLTAWILGRITAVRGRR